MPETIWACPCWRILIKKGSQPGMAFVYPSREDAQEHCDLCSGKTADNGKPPRCIYNVPEDKRVVERFVRKEKADG